MDKTDKETWREIGEVVRRAQGAYWDAHKAIYQERNVPKSARDGRMAAALTQIEDGFTQLKHELEERMNEEHPEWLNEGSGQDSMDVFYGEQPRAEKDKNGETDA